ncbi:ABA4-like family protein [Pontixanthobacter sp.]|uniref:ABA4-like family protein n=1 Tax=Pontixanthobacter sp. TaxID=2792078 RepID=UPI003C7A3FCF
MWNVIFAAANLLALACWITLILLPRHPLALSAIMYCGVGLLCLIYTACMASLVTGLADPVGPRGDISVSTIAGVRAMFATDGGVTIGWVHYLAFDLFAGLWTARDADAKGFSRIVQAPILLLTFLAGPIGLLTWLIVRERAARKLGRMT